MNNNELDIRVLATIRTDLALMARAIREIYNRQDDYMLKEPLYSAFLDLEAAISSLNEAIDKYNELAGKA